MLRVLSRDDVTRILTMDLAIDAVEAAMRSFSAGSATMPLRLTTPVAGRGTHLSMPAVIDAPPTLGIKCVTVFPDNGRTDEPAIQGFVVINDRDTGRPLAIMDAISLTAIRTAAASAVATRLLAAPRASSLALLGAGAQASSHLQAMTRVRPIRNVRIASRSRASATRFVEIHAPRYPDLSLEAVDTPREAVAGSELICTVSSSREPIVERAWLADGVHVNGVGSHGPDVRELDSATMRDARVICDSREAALQECGDILLAIADGAIEPEQVTDELGEVLLGRKPGRRSAQEITVYESCGLAVQDVASAELVYRTAVAENRGVHVPF